MNDLPERKRPAKRVYGTHGGPTIVFVTVCTRRRSPWLANDRAHQELVNDWQAAEDWLVGRYVVMPDHVHMFVSPANEETELYEWIRHWKSTMSNAVRNLEWRCQGGGWDTRMRNAKSFAEKWDYVRENPVRKSLVQRAEDWPFAGELNEFRW